jgi:hypothetical protein
MRLQCSIRWKRDLWRPTEGCERAAQQLVRESPQLGLYVLCPNAAVDNLIAHTEAYAALLDYWPATGPVAVVGHDLTKGHLYMGRDTRSTTCICIKNSQYIHIFTLN